MPGGHKQILSPFTGCKKEKASNKTRKKYVPEGRRQNLAEKDRGSCCNQEEWLEEFLDNKDASLMVVKVMTVKIWWELYWKYKSSSSHMFHKIGILKNFANFTGKHLCWSLFLIKLLTLRPATLLKNDFNTSVFLWNLRTL